MEGPYLVCPFENLLFGPGCEESWNALENSHTPDSSHFDEENVFQLSAPARDASHSLELV